jgi:hypothetical protein
LEKQQQQQHSLLESCDTTLDKLPVFQEEHQRCHTHSDTETQRDHQFCKLKQDS